MMNILMVQKSKLTTSNHYYKCLFEICDDNSYPLVSKLVDFDHVVGSYILTLFLLGMLIIIYLHGMCVKKFKHLT